MAPAQSWLQRLRYPTPGTIMFVACLLALIAGGLTVATSLAQPSLGLKLSADDDVRGLVVQSVRRGGPAAGMVGTGDRIVAIGDANGAEGSLAFETVDLTAEPDVIASFEEYHRFMERQSAIAARLSHTDVTLRIERNQGAVADVTVTPRSRPISALPADFWVQLVSALTIFFVAMLVWAVRPAYLAAQMFALSGISLTVAFLSAAIYSTRELAIDGTLFLALSTSNFVGALGFGLAMIALFLIYPKRLIRPKWLWLLLPCEIILVMPGLYEAIGDTATVRHFPILIEMILIIALVIVQWVLSRNNPIDRASLTWMGLSVVIGAGAFVGLMAVPPLLGMTAFMTQGYAFGFFVLIYIGIALGIRKYRLFDLGTWSFKILFYSFGAVLIMILDALLIAGLNIAAAPSLGIALLITGFVWLPLRDTLWRYIYRKQTMPQDELFSAAMNVAFAPTKDQRTDRWYDLLRRLYDPLEITPAPAQSTVSIKDGGMAMTLPPLAETRALELRYAQSGRSLFGPPHVKLADQIVALVSRAEQTRDAYERGAKEERQRIATDLHDDVGAHLITGLQLSDEKSRPLLRAALTEMRFILSGLSGEATTLSDLLADCRHEMMQRLQAADIKPDWPVAPESYADIELDNQQAKALISSIREIVTNTIRHSGAHCLRSSFEIENDAFHMRISDDGCGLPENGLIQGNGLRNIEKRVTSVGGDLSIENAGPGTKFTMRIPLRKSTDTVDASAA